jgi:hypothetical protein
MSNTSNLSYKDLPIRKVKGHFSVDNYPKNIDVEIKKLDKDCQNEIMKIPHNNILIANFPSYDELIQYVKNNPDQIRHVTFGAKKLLLEESHLKNLDIVMNNSFNDLIKGIWDINEKEILKYLKMCKLANAPKTFSNKTCKYADRNNEIGEMCSIINSTVNRNQINSIRKNTLYSNKNISYENSEIQKYSYISNIIFKKYIQLFYNIQTQKIDPAKKVFIYNYYMNNLKNYKDKSHKELLQEAKKEYSHTSDEDNIELKLSKDLCDSLSKLFADKNNSDIKNIKSLFTEDKRFRYITDPVELFRQDLMKLNINFDYYNSSDYFNDKLPENIKILYELRYYQSKLIFEYREILRNKYKKLEINNKKEKPTSLAKKRFNKLSSIITKIIKVEKICHVNIPEKVEEEKKEKMNTNNTNNEIKEEVLSNNKKNKRKNMINIGRTLNESNKNIKRNNSKK